MSNEDNEFSHILYEAEMYLKTYRFTVGDQVFTNLVRANHAIHLRNLAYFFKKEPGKKSDWHYSEFLVDSNPVKPLSRNQFKEISRFCSGAVGHLSKERKSFTYKPDTTEAEDKAFPLMVHTFLSFLDALDRYVAPDYELNWWDCDIQFTANSVRELCVKCSSGGGAVLSGCCKLDILDEIPFDGAGTPARYYKIVDGLFVPTT